jgi:aryl-alcohol dehydrogenase-like predicted oxidoreductase
MDNLSSKGIVRHWGATTYWESDALDTLAIPGRIRTLQVAYSLLDQRLEKRLFPHCKKQKTAVILRSIFLKGALSHRAGNLPPELSDLRQESQKAGRIADAAGIRLPALALRFVAFNPHVQITLFGTTSIAETKANTAAFQEGPLPLDVIEQLNHLRVDDEQMLKPVYLTPGWA